MACMAMPANSTCPSKRDSRHLSIQRPTALFPIAHMLTINSAAKYLKLLLLCSFFVFIYFLLRQDYSVRHIPHPGPPAMLSERVQRLSKTLGEPWMFAPMGSALYDKEKNPSGIVSFGTAENVYLPFPLFAYQWAQPVYRRICL